MRRALVSLSIVLAAAGCDVALQDLRVLVWQPEQLAEGAGDLLADASTLRVSLTVDGEEQSFSLTDGRSVEGRVGAPEGSSVVVGMRSVGSALPDAVGRSGLVELAPGEGAVDAPLVLAPPERTHALSVTVPDAREGVAACGDEDGRAWMAGGNVGANTPPGSFVADPFARTVGEGPALLPGRTRASCVADGGGGVYLLGGCAVDGTPAGELLHAEGGAGGSFEPVLDVGAAGCDARLLRTAGGALIAFQGDRVQWIDPADPTSSAPVSVSPARFGATAVLVGPGEENAAHVLLVGGFNDAARTTPTPGASLVRVRANTDATVTSFSPVPTCVGAGRDGAALAVVDGDVVELAPEGFPTVLVANVATGDADAAAVAPIGATAYAVLSADGATLRIARPGEELDFVSVSPPRPGAALLSDPGGALRLAGGGVAGVAVVVVE